MKYLLLFYGGSIPEDKKDQSVVDRLAWMNDLRREGKLIDGSPLQSQGKNISASLQEDYVHDSDSINGFAVIEADDMREAAALGGLAPQLKQEYGAATLEIRPLQPLT